MCFDYSITHVPEIELKIADALSRSPVSSTFDKDNKFSKGSDCICGHACTESTSNRQEITGNTNCSRHRSNLCIVNLNSTVKMDGHTGLR